jgi:hypothetical protein
MNRGTDLTDRQPRFDRISVAERAKGSVLILSLWSISILGIFVSSLAFQTGAQIRLAQAEMNGFRSHIDLVSGLNLASLMIASDPEPYEDSSLDSWYGEIKLPDSWKEKLSVRIEDEESKLNLNLAGEKLLAALLDSLQKDEGIRIKGDAKDFVNAVLEWRSGKKNHTFEFLEELLLMEEMEREDFEKLKPYITVSSDVASFPVVNVNTALPAVLKAIVAAVPGDEFRKKEFLERLLEYREGKGEEERIFRREELEPRLFASILKLSPTVEMIGFLNGLLPYLTADSNTFHVSIQLQDGSKKAEAIIRQREDQLEPVILFWNEDWP